MLLTFLKYKEKAEYKWVCNWRRRYVFHKLRHTNNNNNFRENITKILGCKDVGTVYKTHIYVHSNFLSCKMSLVFVFSFVVKFKGEMYVYILLSVFFLLFCNFLLQQTNIEIICRRKTLGAARRFWTLVIQMFFLPIISIIRTSSMVNVVFRKYMEFDYLG